MPSRLTSTRKVVRPLQELTALAESLLRRQHTVRFQANGSSMTPTIQSGDVLMVEPLRAHPRMGDVLLYQLDSGGMIAHRAIFTHPRRGCLMWGDGHRRPDGWIRHEQILGVVTDIEQSGRIRPMRRLPGIAIGLVQNLRLLKRRLARRNLRGM